MSWVDLPAINETDWSALAFVDQFVAAVIERCEAVDMAHTLVRPEVGTDVQSASWWSELQRHVELLAPLYYPRTLRPDGHSGETTWPTWTAEQMLQEAGIAAGAWTRRYPREIATLDDAGEAGQVARHAGSQFPVDPQTVVGTGDIYVHDGDAWVRANEQTISPDWLEASGRMQAGDYIGPWVFNELYQALRLLTWSWHVFRWVNESPVVWRKLGEGLLAEDEASAKAAAEAMFASSGDTSTGEVFPPRSVSSFASGGLIFDPHWDALLESIEAVGSLDESTGPLRPKDGSRWYVRPHRGDPSSNTRTFDSGGLFPTGNDEWYEFDSQSGGPSDISEMRSARWGSLDAMAWSEDPPNPLGGLDRGWVLTSGPRWRVVVQWVFDHP